MKIEGMMMGLYGMSRWVKVGKYEREKTHSKIHTLIIVSLNRQNERTENMTGGAPASQIWAPLFWSVVPGPLLAPRITLFHSTPKAAMTVRAVTVATTGMTPRTRTKGGTRTTVTRITNFRNRQACYIGSAY